MEQLKTIFQITVASLLFAVTSYGADYVPGKYEVDNAHTRASFVVPHFVVSEIEGRFNEVKGEFVLAPKFSDTKLTATIPVAVA